MPFLLTSLFHSMSYRAGKSASCEIGSVRSKSRPMAACQDYAYLPHPRFLPIHTYPTLSPLTIQYTVRTYHVSNILSEGQNVYVVFKYLSKSLLWGRQSIRHPISQLNRGHFIKRRRNRYSPPRCFLHKTYVHAAMLQYIVCIWTEG